MGNSGVWYLGILAGEEPPVWLLNLAVPLEPFYLVWPWMDQNFSDSIH